MCMTDKGRIEEESCQGGLKVRKRDLASFPPRASIPIVDWGILLRGVGNA